MTKSVISPDVSGIPSVQHPHDRQILTLIGNRYVVFGSGASLPDQRSLGPADVVNRLPRVDEPRDRAETRIVDTLFVEGFEVQPVAEDSFGDVAIVDSDGRRALVEIKVGDRDFAGLDLGQASTELAPSAEAGERREIWAFNFERLNLGIVWSEGRFAPSFEQLHALDVWEFNPDGSVFDRRRVLDGVRDWVGRVDAIYAEVESWARADGMDVKRDRTVPLSEEIMQHFAVPDRDMPILDVIAEGKPVVSMVPAGLWLIGLSGMIDVITRSGTFRLGGIRQDSGPPRWVVIDGRTRTQTDWSREAFTSILGLTPVGK